MLLLFFLSSGLFLGWSLGANDAANVFGSAVGTRMIRFGRAAVICSVFVVIGAVVGGAGTSHTLGKLGAIDAIGGAFMAALAAGLTVTVMTKLGLPVSTSQAIVGAIVGWNLFTGSLTDTASLTRIVGTWVLCPILSGISAVIFHKCFTSVFRRLHLHLLWEDMFTRWSLVAVGAFASYSLGANNIANVMGVFVPVAPFASVDVGGLFTITGTQQLFLIGGLAIAFGVVTYSRKVMATVGGSLMRLTPQMALVVVLSQSVVLFVFSSQSLEAWLMARGLPTVPLVPVSSSQAVIGAVVGLGLMKGGRGVRYRMLCEIAAGWVTTPIISGAVAFVALFFLQNTFGVPIARDLDYVLDADVLARVERLDIRDSQLADLEGRTWPTQIGMMRSLGRRTALDTADRRRVLDAAELDHFVVSLEVIEREFSSGILSYGKLEALNQLAGQEYRHGWQLLEALAQNSDEWSLHEGADDHAAARMNTLQTTVLSAFRADSTTPAMND